MELSGDDRVTTLAIETTFDAHGLERFIHTLVLRRGEMLPAVPTSMEGAVHADAPVFVMEPYSLKIGRPAEGGLRFWLRHDGLGFIVFEMSAAGVADLIELIGRQGSDGGRAN